MTERVKVDVAEAVATVALNRPEKHNAVDMAMFEALAEAGMSLRDDPAVRSIVLCGRGSNFCAGIDVSVFAGAGIGASGEHRMQAGADTPANFFQRVAWIWQEVPVPVIAALHGVVFGAGLQIALGADIRFAAPDARLSIMEIKWGIIPDMAITGTALHLVPPDKLKELAFTGRIIDGAEALASGLVTAVHDDPLAAAQSLAQEIAGRSPDAVRAIKTLVNETWRGDTAGSLRREAELQITLMGGRNQAEAVAANLERRAPRFTDPER